MMRTLCGYLRGCSNCPSLLLWCARLGTNANRGAARWEHGGAFGQDLGTRRELGKAFPRRPLPAALGQGDERADGEARGGEPKQCR